MLGLTSNLPALSPAALAAAEQELGLSLPPSYRQFLLTHNGGLISGWAFAYDLDLAPEGYSPAEDGIEVSEFFGISAVGQGGTLAQSTGPRRPGDLLTLARACHQQLAQTGLQLPADWIWIGRTAHDDELLLATSGSQAGSIYLLYARDEYFEEDFKALFNSKGCLEYPEDLQISRDIQRFLHGAVPLAD